MWHEVIYARLHRTIQSSKTFRSCLKTIEKKTWRQDIESVEGNGIEKNGALAQLARAPALQAGCQGFESLMLHHNISGV